MGTKIEVKNKHKDNNYSINGKQVWEDDKKGN